MGQVMLQRAQEKERAPCAAESRLSLSSPDVFPIEECEEAQFHHVPGGAVIVPHQV